jgi:hypothetical protein
MEHRSRSVAMVGMTLVAVFSLTGAGPDVLAAQVPPPPATVVAPSAATGTTVAPTTLPPVREPGKVRVLSTCPAGATYPPDLKPNTPEFNEFVSAQSHLQRTIEQVQQYAITQPATFGDLRFGGKHNGTVVVSFTRDLQVHADALTKLVDVPNGVVVCPAAQTAAARVALANELVNRANGAMVGGSLTPPSGPPVVMLRADRRDVADDLVRTYGSRVQVVLGEFVYPDRTVVPLYGESNRPCGSLPTPGPSSGSLKWSVPKALRIHSGGDVNTQVSWKNNSRRAVTYESGDPITGLVTAVGGSRVLARYSGAIAGVGHGLTLRAGRTDRVQGLVSTASCDASLGYALPPGKYSVRFVFGGFDYTANGGMKSEQFVSNPIPLTITKDAPPPLPKLPQISAVTLPGAGGGGPGATLAAFPTTTPP